MEWTVLKKRKIILTLAEEKIEGEIKETEHEVARIKRYRPKNMISKLEYYEKIQRERREVIEEIQIWKNEIERMF